MKNEESRRVLYLFFVSFIASASVAYGNIGDFTDVYWKQKAEEARAAAEAAYNPDPLGVTTSFNAAVQKSMAPKNISGRSLRPIYTGPCRAMNPIDRCWRCRADWASDRHHLASCAKGFGRRAYGGGKDSEIYVVDDPSDNPQEPTEGMLRWGVIQEKPLWIVFAHDMVIKLKEELIMTSHKTIDGRGANVHIAYGASIMIQYVSNVIIHGLHIHHIVPKSGGMVRSSVSHIGLRTVSDGDGISIFGGTNVWIDHVSMSECSDGLIDAVMGSTAITISNGHYTSHNDVMLFGASDSYEGDSIMQITLAFNHFGRNLVQRMPRARWGFVHVVNNDYTHWLMYAVGGSRHPTIISQGNRYTAPANPNAKEATKRDYAPENVWSGWNWTSEGDLYRNGAFFRASGVLDSKMLTGKFSRFDVIKAKPGSFVTRLTRFSGALNCRVGKPC